MKKILEKMSKKFCLESDVLSYMIRALGKNFSAANKSSSIPNPYITNYTVGVGACIHIAFFLFYLLSTFIVAFSSPHDDVRKVGQNFPTIQSKSWVLTVGKVCMEKSYNHKVETFFVPLLEF